MATSSTPGTSTAVEWRGAAAGSPPVRPELKAKIDQCIYVSYSYLSALIRLCGGSCLPCLALASLQMQAGRDAEMAVLSASRDLKS